VTHHRDTIAGCSLTLESMEGKEEVMSTITYRQATSDDLEALATLRFEMEVEQGNEDVDGKMDPQVYAHAYVNSTGEEMKGRRNRVWLAEADGEAVACVLLVWWVLPPTFDNLRRKRGFVSSVFTRPAYRRQGVARHLMQMLIASAREEGIGRLILWSSEMGRPLYEHLGFTGSRGLELNL
jgi:ribosomal protein S18 acetylase RimI-like enzyme